MGDEGHAEFSLHVRAGDVDLNEVGFCLGHDCGYLTELLGTAPEDAGDQGHPQGV